MHVALNQAFSFKCSGCPSILNAPAWMNHLGSVFHCLRCNAEFSIGPRQAQLPELPAPAPSEPDWVADLLEVGAKTLLTTVVVGLATAAGNAIVNSIVYSKPQRRSA